MGRMFMGRIILLSCLAASAWGCAADPFESGSVINSLRVLAVQKQPAYGKPDGEVELKMLVWDGKADPAAPRPIEFAWIGGCKNPFTDTYYYCFAQFGQNAATPPQAGDSGVAGDATTVASDATAANGADGPDGASETADGAETEGAGGADADRGGVDPGIDAADAGMPGDPGGDAGAGAAYDGGAQDGGQTSSEAGGSPDNSPDASVPAATGPTVVDVGRFAIGGADLSLGRLYPAAISSSVLPQEALLSYSIRIPSKPEIITRTQSGNTPYGVEFVFYAVCAGKLEYLPGSTSAFPLGCYDSDHRQLGAEDFLVGYSQVFVYEELTNQNPIVTGFSFDNRVLPAQPTAEERAALAPHVPRCTASDSDNCRAFRIQAIIDRASAETDPDAKDQNGGLLQEQMWVSFYATRGGFKHSSKLVNDATKGWNDANETEWRTPLEAGPVRIWAVVHDNRGGMAWSEVDVIVDP